MKFARTIRFDKSDLNIFPVAAEEGELALVGTFLGADHKKELKRCFKEQGLKYGDARKPKTFEQWQKSYTHMMLLRHRQRQAK